MNQVLVYCCQHTKITQLDSSISQCFQNCAMEAVTAACQVLLGKGKGGEGRRKKSGNSQQFCCIGIYFVVEGEVDVAWVAVDCLLIQKISTRKNQDMSL